MPVITLPDGSQRTYAGPVTVAQVAADIGPGLAKAALAGKVNGKLVDTSFAIEQDAALRAAGVGTVLRKPVDLRALETALAATL